MKAPSLWSGCWTRRRSAAPRRAIRQDPTQHGPLQADLGASAGFLYSETFHMASTPLVLTVACFEIAMSRAIFRLSWCAQGLASVSPVVFTRFRARRRLREIKQGFSGDEAFLKPIRHQEARPPPRTVNSSAIFARRVGSYRSRKPSPAVCRRTDVMASSLAPSPIIRAFAS